MVEFKEKENSMGNVERGSGAWDGWMYGGAIWQAVNRRKKGKSEDEARNN